MKEIKRGYIVNVKGEKGFWRIIEINPNNICTLIQMDENGKCVKTKHIDELKK